MKCLISAVAIIATLASGPALAEDWSLLWSAKNLPNPESVVYDPTRELLFVSNQAYGSDPGSNSGSISTMTLDGAMVNAAWATGLNEPKGILVLGNRVFVSDVTDLVEINAGNGDIVKRHTKEGTKFLNDVAADAKGNVYVSDMFTSSIYRLDSQGNFSLWLQTPDLDNPNGLFIKGDELFVAGWGPFTNGKPLEAPKGRLLKVSILTKKITSLSTETIGNLDGLQPIGDGFLLTDWVAGGVLHWTPKDCTRRIIDTEQSPGDIAYLSDRDIVYVPMAVQGEVRAYARSGLAKPAGIRREGSTPAGC